MNRSDRFALALGAALVLLATGATLIATNLLLGAAGTDLALMALTLLATGAVGLGVALVAPRWFGRMGLRGQFALVGSLGLALMIANVAVVAALMFISGHDLRLLFLLAAFALAATAGPIVLLSARASARLRGVEQAAAQLAAGDLTTRAVPGGSDEVARLAAEFNRMADALEAANTRRDQVESARRELFAAISHDLRTPLSSLRVMVDALCDGVVTDVPTQERYLKTMSKELERLSALIDDLFELAKIESGELALHLETLPLGPVLVEALDAFRPQAERDSILLKLEGGADCAVRADSFRLGRVLYNLLHNALQHTPGDGTIILRTTTIPGFVEVAVSDSGAGIAPDDAPFVFDRFFRGDKARTRERAGSGLGLSIARAIVEAHGGRIWVESIPGAGATVSFSLPTAG